MKFHEIFRNFMISAEFSYFWRNFTIFGVLERFESSRGAWKPQYSYRNNKVFSMWRPGTHQNPPNVIFSWFWWNFMNFAENGEISHFFVKLIDFYGFSSFGESKPLRPWFWARNTKVSWRVAESRKSMNFVKFHDFHDFSYLHWNSWFSINFIELTRNPPYSAGMQKHT